MSNGALLVKQAYVGLGREVGDGELYRAALEARRHVGITPRPAALA